jgi:prevent-host-death family protein
MPNVGVKELRDHLSNYLEKVKKGEVVIVTDRGKAVASIVPIEQEDLMKEILPLIKKGIVSWSGGKPKGNPNPPVIKGRPTSEIALEGRR